MGRKSKIREDICIRGASQVALVLKNLSVNAGDRRRGFDPWLGKVPGGGHRNPLQDSCLENLMDRGAWWATYSPWGHKELDTTEAT